MTRYYLFMTNYYLFITKYEIVITKYNLFYDRILHLLWPNIICLWPNMTLLRPSITFFITTYDFFNDQILHFLWPTMTCLLSISWKKCQQLDLLAPAARENTCVSNIARQKRPKHWIVWRLRQRINTCGYIACKKDIFKYKLKL